MSINAAALRKLATLGLSGEQMAGVLDLLASVSEDEDKRKEAARERTRRSREKAARNVTVASQQRNKVRDGSHGGVAPVDDNFQTTEIEPQVRKQDALKREFEEWYGTYPHKVQRGTAERAFPKARQLASQAQLVEGVRRYVASKPPERAWLNPASWLNGKSWLDEPASVNASGTPPPRSRGVGGVFSDMVEQFENGQGYDNRGGEASGQAVLSLPYRLAG